MPRASREEVPTALGEGLEGRVTDAGSSPAASMLHAVRNQRGGSTRSPRHSLLQYMVPLLGKGHNGDFTLKMGEDATILGVHEILDPVGRRAWRLALLVLDDNYSKVVPFHFLVKGLTERVHLPSNGAWNCVGTVQSRSGYVWAVFQVWPDEVRTIREGD